MNIVGIAVPEDFRVIIIIIARSQYCNYNHAQVCTDIHLESSNVNRLHLLFDVSRFQQGSLLDDIA